MRSTLRKTLTDAQKKGLVTQNVATLSESVEVEKHAKEWLTEEQILALLSQVQGDRLEALYVLMVSTGLRRGEALGLSWENIQPGQRDRLGTDSDASTVKAVAAETSASRTFG